jgi:hypothetical protein
VLDTVGGRTRRKHTHQKFVKLSHRHVVGVVTESFQEILLSSYLVGSPSIEAGSSSFEISIGIFHHMSHTAVDCETNLYIGRYFHTLQSIIGKGITWRDVISYFSVVFHFFWRNQQSRNIVTLLSTHEVLKMVLMVSSFLLWGCKKLVSVHQHGYFSFQLLSARWESLVSRGKGTHKIIFTDLITDRVSLFSVIVSGGYLG